MQIRTVEQLLRVRRAHDACRETLAAASAEARAGLRAMTTPEPAFAPYRQAEAALDAQCRFPGDFSCPMTPEAYQAAIAAMPPANEYDRQLRERVRVKARGMAA